MFATEIEFAQPGIYFLVLNYTATENSSASVFVGDIKVPTMLPTCSKCLIMLAGQSTFKDLYNSRVRLRRKLRFSYETVFEKLITAKLSNFPHSWWIKLI